MKRISGNMLALVGLIFGLVAGIGIVVGKEYLIREIVGALEDEVKASCSTCHLDYETFSISLLSRTGRATDVRLLDGNDPRLTFKEITASFSINEILQKRVYIDSLVLSDGHSEGVGPDSVTFRFIDQLTAPLPPEKQIADRWRAILNSLEIRTTTLRESFGTSELYGAEVGLFVKRIGETFVLLPSLGDLRYRTFTNEEHTTYSDLPLGQLSASVVIEDAQTVFNSLKLGRDISSFELKGAADNDDRLTGTSAYNLDAQYIGLPDWLKGVFSGQGVVKGTLGSPIIAGSLSPQPNAPLTLAFPHASPIQLSSVSGDVEVDVNHGDPIVTLRNIKGAGDKSTLASSSPLTFSDKGLAAGFDVSLPSFTYGPFAITEAKGHIDVKPSSQGTITSFLVNAGDLKVQGTSLGPCKLNITISPRSVSVQADSTDPRLGSLHWEGTIDTDLPEPTLRNGKLVLVDYRYPYSIPVDPEQISPFQLTTTLALSGPLNLASLSGEGPTTLSIPTLHSGLTMSGKTTLKDGTLTVNLPTSAHRGTANLKIDVAKTFAGKLNVSFPSIPLSQFVQEADCGVIDATLDYSFSASQPLAGSGSLALGDLHFGCEPYVLRLPKNSSLPISQGALRFKNTKISSGNSLLELNGSLGFDPGADLSLSGQAYLSSFLPLLPSVDNLQGLLTTKLTMKGPISSPAISGTAALEKGELSIASPDLGAHNVQGTFVLSGNSIRVDSFTGSINNGTVSVTGNLLPFDWPNSRLSAILKEVTVEPVEDASITFSGDLSLGTNKDKHQSLSGNIAIDFAEISKDFDLNRILIQTIKGYFLPARLQPQVSRKQAALDLDVSLSAPRNIFVLTPFFSAELSCGIHAGGTTSDPSLTGSMQLLSGWVGLKGNRFDVTAGSLDFKPGSLTPYIQIASEGQLRAPTGESILVILEAAGPLTSPRISLSSDRGLSQEELLLLITSSRSLTGRTMANRVGTQFSEDKRFFLSQDSFSSVGAFFRNLTKIDTLSFEPTYNQYTGLVEPAIVAKKNLAPRFALVGNSLFSSVSNSRAGVVYNLSPSLDVNAFVQSVSTQQNAIVSSDLTYTILSEQPSLVEITVEGTDKTDAQDILIAARIGRESRIKDAPESLAMIQRDIILYLNQLGFLSSRVEVVCRRATQQCEDLVVRIHEGPEYLIGKVSTEGSDLPEPVRNKIFSIAQPGQVATGARLEEIERQLVIALRNEGYIAARVTPTYRPSEIPNVVDLLVTSDIREPITFMFTGNTVFSPEQFLNSIDLFSRKRPFGNNTIKLLVENIEQMYQSSGYLFAQVSFTEDRSDPKRLVYHIAIAEEAQTKVRDLTITGNDALTRRQIKDAMRALGFSEQVEMLDPTYAIPAQLDTLRDILESVFQQEGFPQVQVSYTIEPVEQGSALDVVYKVVQGPPTRAGQVTLKNFPGGITPPSPPPVPVSLPNLNQYIETLIAMLQEEGFLFPSVDTEPSADNSHIDLIVNAGPRTIISAMTIEGLGSIEKSVAEKYIKLSVGAPYRLEDVNATKRELLRSGLFSRVEVLATDGIFESPEEAITVRLLERPLQTLEVGTGANSEFGLHVFGEAVDKSLFSDGRSLSTRIDTYFDQARINPSGSDAVSQGFANLRYLDPFFMDSNYALTEEIRFQRQDLSTQEFNLDRLLLASYLFRQLDSGVTFTGGHSLTFDNLVDVTPGAIISPLDEGHVRLSFLSGVLKFDHRDDPLSPRAGYTFTLEPRLSMETIGSEANFGAILARATGIVPLDFLSPRFSLGLGLFGGIGQPWGDTEEIPITQRFYLGGRTTVRGFKENSLGPRGSDGAVIGGDTLLAEKNQLQYLVTDSLSTHVFVDVGNVYLRHESFSLGDLRTSTGLGLQYLSPIGPIGFDVGHPLKQESGESSIRFHFSVGSAF